jgi:hypothetical protein
VEASNESSKEHEGWGYIEHALSLSHPEAFCLSPFFSRRHRLPNITGTYAESIYRFTAPSPKPGRPRPVGPAANERVKISDLERCASFYTNLIGSPLSKNSENPVRLTRFNVYRM